jgi:phosphoribosylaminoimidazole-succinocarboxamide synthase
MSSPEQIINEVECGPEIANGKTKRLFEAVGHPKLTVAEYKNDTTAYDDPTKTRVLENKARCSNTINARVMEMLNDAGIPTAFERQLGERKFLAQSCTMIPLEVVVRRYPKGSYVDRHPEYKTDEKIPAPFDKPVVEFFLKTTKGGLRGSDGEMLVKDLDPKKGEEDPFIENPDDPEWVLVHPKKTVDDPESPLGRTVAREKIIADPEAIGEMREMIVRTLEVLEAFFKQYDFHLMDFKIEFGVTQDGKLVIADVLDNDSWRLRDPEGNDVSKQSFRDKVAVGDEDFTDVMQNYEIVAELLERSRKP